MSAGRPLLEVRGLRVVFAAPGGGAAAVDGVDLTLAAGEIYGLAGESGSGKTTLGLALLRLVGPPAARLDAERIRFEGRDLLHLSGEEMREVRGAGIAMIFQHPSAAFNPVRRVGGQVAEALRPRRSRREALRRAQELLREAGLPAPREAARAYPHELSGGMLQRALIAAALGGGARLLVADEPTSALDVTVQAGILDLLRRLREESGLAVLLITHDLHVLAELADRVGVMYAGRIVEEAPVEDLFRRPLHPYTEGLLAALPSRTPPGARPSGIPGAPPSPASWPAGCRFHPRCARAIARCAAQEPRPLGPGPERLVACHLHEEAQAR